MWIAQREASPERTFGIYRVEVLAAMLNVIALWLIVAWIFFEAYHRFTLEGTQVDGGPVLIVGTGGLIVNIIALITELQAVAHDRYGIGHATIQVESLVEIQSFDRVAVHEDIAGTVDRLLRGFDAEAEVRTIGADGEVAGATRVPVPSTRGEAPEPARERASRSRDLPPAPGGPLRRILPFGVSRSRLEQAIHETRSDAEVVDRVADADAVMTLRPYYRRRSGPLREAASRGIPVYVLRNNTISQMEQSLMRMRGDGEGPDPTTSALRETEEAIAAVNVRGDRQIELAPQNAYIRRLQHELAARHGATSVSRGREPYRRVMLTSGDGAVREIGYANGGAVPGDE